MNLLGTAYRMADCCRPSAQSDDDKDNSFPTPPVSPSDESLEQGHKHNLQSILRSHGQSSGQRIRFTDETVQHAQQKQGELASIYEESLNKTGSHTVAVGIAKIMTDIKWRDEADEVIPVIEDELLRARASCSDADFIETYMQSFTTQYLGAKQDRESNRTHAWGYANFYPRVDAKTVYAEGTSFSDDASEKTIKERFSRAVRFASLYAGALTEAQSHLDASDQHLHYYAHGYAKCMVKFLGVTGLSEKPGIRKKKHSIAHDYGMRMAKIEHARANSLREPT